MSWLTDKLISLMAERELGADVIARQLALERSRMNNILSGESIPNPNLIKRLAVFFGEDSEDWLRNVEARQDATGPVWEVPPDFFKVATVDEIPEGEMKIVFNDLAVVAHAEGAFYAFGNVCPHAGGPIGEGFIDGCVVECPWHAGRWDVKTGKALTLLATSDIPRFEVRVVGRDVELKVDTAALRQGIVSCAGPDPR